MLRRGAGDPNKQAVLPRVGERNGNAQDHHHHPTLPSSSSPSPPPLRGLLKLLQGQIPTDDDHRMGIDMANHEARISVYRYHGQTLRESQKELQKHKKKKKKTSSNRTRHDDEEANGESPSSMMRLTSIPQSHHAATFGSCVRRHKFVAFFVVQGLHAVRGNRPPCYSVHTLHLRRLLAQEYHDVLTTFVVDVGSRSATRTAAWGVPVLDEESGGDRATADNDDDNNPFLRGTGFGLFPTSLASTATVLALLNVSKIPSVVVLDAVTGRVVVGDAILAMERNDPHTVVNRWQANKSGLSLLQQLAACVTCDCAHGPCCSGSGGSGCCVVQ